MTPPVAYVRRLPRDLVIAATRQTHELWGDGRTLAAHTANVFEQLRAAGPELLRYAGLVERGRLVASMKRYSLLLTKGAAPAQRALGIGAVFTSPRMRGRGLAPVLLSHVMEEARELGYAAAILYSDIDPRYYERLGFRPLVSRDFLVDVEALPSRGALDVRRARATDVPAIVHFYERAIHQRHPSWLRPARTPALFRFFAWRNDPGIWIVHRRGRDIGYLLARADDAHRDLPHPREPGLFWFDEAWLPGIENERVWATVRCLAERARSRRVRGWVGPGGVPPGARRVARGGAFPMIAPLVGGLVVRSATAYIDSFQHF